MTGMTGFIVYIQEIDEKGVYILLGKVWKQLSPCHPVISLTNIVPHRTLVT